MVAPFRFDWPFFLASGAARMNLYEAKSEPQNIENRMSKCGIAPLGLYEKSMSAGDCGLGDFYLRAANTGGDKPRRYVWG